VIRAMGRRSGGFSLCRGLAKALFHGLGGSYLEQLYFFVLLGKRYLSFELGRRFKTVVWREWYVWE
jgi:hypothetical protein